MKRDVDITKPNAGRIYDYLLGGTRNFEADRSAAEQFIKLIPSAGVATRLNRWFLQMVASRWSEEGRKRVLDLGSGLPTQGHFNDYITDGHILFSDNDVLVVEDGQDLIKDKPTMRYAQADLREPEALVDIARSFFGDDRRIGVSLIGVSYFLADDELRRLAQAVHAFAAPGSVLAMSFFLPLPEGSLAADVFAMYKRMVTNAFPRLPEQVAELIAPWRITEQAALEDWLAVPDVLTPEDRETNKMKGMGIFAAH